METNDRNLDFRDAFTLVPVVANLLRKPLCAAQFLAGAGGRQTAVLLPGRHFLITCRLEIPSAGSVYVQSNPLMWALSPWLPS